jgi:negative regulator of flagellin synthesis FlgM
MKINNGNGTPYINPYQKVQPVNKIEKSKAVSNQDQLQISTEAKEMLTKKAEEARADKITKLKEQVANGTYTVNSEEVANKLFAKWFK